MRIIFVRHADPDYGKDSLTQKGFKEAELLVPRISKLDVKDFYCSPLGRAKDTAKPTLNFMNRSAKTLDWLKEFPAHIKDEKTGNDTHPWDLMPSYWTNDRKLYDKDEWIKTDLMQSGDVEKVYNYVISELDKLIAKYNYVRENNYYRVEKENRDTIVLFCHFGIECVLLSHLLGVSPVILWQGFVASPSSVTTLITEERQQGIAYFRCNGFGDISHLYAANEPPAFAARFCETFSSEDERH
ncbi:MAG: histidine phosphatase family protein [Clostridia bacterium]|nr:histidine phosphatase family protein [Clostridia bacterium]